MKHEFEIIAIRGDTQSVISTGYSVPELAAMAEGYFGRNNFDRVCVVNRRNKKVATDYSNPAKVFECDWKRG